MMSADMELVREYAACQSDQAFEMLVGRHVSLVYSAALRQVGDPHLAQEVTQAVFIILARKAKSLGPETILSSWLYRTARYAAADALKTQRRRELVPATASLEMLVVEKASDKAGKDKFLEPLAESDCAPRTDSALQGRWEGTVKIENALVQMRLKIAEPAENTFRAEADLVELQRKGVQATFFSYSRPTVIMEFGEFANTTFTGDLGDNGKEIKGSITRVGEVQPLILKRMD